MYLSLNNLLPIFLQFGRYRLRHYVDPARACMHILRDGSVSFLNFW